MAERGGEEFDALINQRGGSRGFRGTGDLFSRDWSHRHAPGRVHLSRNVADCGSARGGFSIATCARDARRVDANERKLQFSMVEK